MAIFPFDRRRPVNVNDETDGMPASSFSEDSWGQRQAKSQSFPELNGGVLIVNANGNAAMDRNNGKAKAFNGWRGEGTPPSTRMHNNQLNISR